MPGGTPSINGGGSCSTEGLVLAYYSVGNTAPANAPYNLGRTATHEIGHCFGLRHIWGDGVGTCATDYCADTPPHDAPNFSCPGGQINSGCATPTPMQWMNFMDYTDDACMWMFTNEQRTRMHTTMWKSPRHQTLSTSQVCFTPPTSVVLAANATRICAGQSVTFNDATVYGASTMRPIKWRYTTTTASGCAAPAAVVVTNTSLPIAALGGLPTVGANPTGSTSITFPNAGVYTVTLTDTIFLNTNINAVRGTGICASCNAFVSFSKSLVITVNPRPTVSIIPAGPANCVNSVTLNSAPIATTSCGITGSSTFTYNWLPNSFITSQTVQNPIVSPTGSSVNYTLTVTDGNGCTNAATPSVTVNACTNPIQLPITLVSFGGFNMCDVNSNTLKWQTSSMLNFSHFEIERSNDGMQFYNVGMVTSTSTAASQEFSFIDANATNNLYYYRLKMVDVNGNTKISNIISLKCSKFEKDFQLFPNPAQDFVTIQWQSILQNFQVNLYSSIGELIMSKHIKNNASNTYTMNIKNLQAGKYFIRVINSKEASVQSFIKH
jgi:hypothetical protein